MIFWGSKKGAPEPVNSETNTGKEKKSSKTRKAKSEQPLKITPAIKSRFETYFDPKKRHWIWQGSLTHDGYAQFWVNEKKVVKAHRLAFEVYQSNLKPKARLKNQCGDIRCINPKCWLVAGAN